jgi:hypothetical protein
MSEKVRDKSRNKHQYYDRFSFRVMLRRLTILSTEYREMKKKANGFMSSPINVEMTILAEPLSGRLSILLQHIEYRDQEYQIRIMFHESDFFLKSFTISE